MVAPETVAYKLDNAELGRVFDYIMLYGKAPRRIFALSLPLVFTVLYIFAHLALDASRTLAVGVSFLSLPFAFAVAYPMIRRVFCENQSKVPGALGSRLLTIEHLGVREKTATTDSYYAWVHIDAVRVLRGDLVVMSNEGPIIVVPRSAFVDSTSATELAKRLADAHEACGGHAKET
jgi:hypothetical protein